MAYSDQERNHALDLVAQLIGRGRSVRTSLDIAAHLTGISYQTLSRWHYEVKERPSTNVKMAEMGICWNRKQAMLARRGALDKMCRLYRRMSGNNEDMDTLRHHFLFDVVEQKIKLIKGVEQLHKATGNQKMALRIVADEFDFPYSRLEKMYKDSRWSKGN